MLNNKSILITGGTGSLGKALTKHIFKTYPNIKKLIILSRDEQKQFQMAHDSNFVSKTFLWDYALFSVIWFNYSLRDCFFYFFILK